MSNNFYIETSTSITHLWDKFIIVKNRSNITKHSLLVANHILTIEIVGQNW